MLTQDELGRDAGVASFTISRIESGAVEPRYSTVRKIAQALGLDPIYLWTGEESDIPKEGAPELLCQG